jgi:zinc ribbon protein
MTRCPYCGRENPTDADFCVYCGFSLQWGSEENRSADEPVERAASIATPPADTLRPSARIVPVDAPPATSGWKVFRGRVSRSALTAAAIAAAAVIAIVWVVAGQGGGDDRGAPFVGPAGDWVSHKAVSLEGTPADC